MTYAHCAEFHCHPTFWRINECRESLLFDVYGKTAPFSRRQTFLFSIDIFQGPTRVTSSQKRERRKGGIQLVVPT